jgi:hypothetical protein
MYKSTTKCNETIGKWCKNKHGASKIIDTFETYHGAGEGGGRRSQNVYAVHMKRIYIYVNVPG